MTRLTKQEITAVLPNDIGVEQAFLASVFHDNKIVKEIPDITANDFYDDMHKVIFGAMLDLAEDGIEIDLVTLKNNMLKNKTRDTEDILLYYFDVVNNNSTSAGASTYAKILKDYSLKRHIITESHALIEKAHENNTESDYLKTRVYHFAHSMDEIHLARGKLSVEVKQWVYQQEGHFFLTEIYKNIGIFDKIDKTNVSQVLGRMVKGGEIERFGNKSGCFRKIDNEAEVIDWKSNNGKPLDIRYPLGIERFFHTMSKNIILLAGSADSGKTAMLLNFVQLNMNRHNVWYFSSEMGAMELKSRLIQFDDVQIDDWRFEARERADNFSDVIRPDDINVIDFLEISDNFFQISQKLTDIYKRLNKGIAIIALQKDSKAKLGRGADFTLEKPRLYLTLDSNYPHGQICKIVKAKNWRDSEVNPNGYYHKFKIVKGCTLKASIWETDHE